jgi:hypothetical protein
MGVLVFGAVIQGARTRRLASQTKSCRSLLHESKGRTYQLAGPMGALLKLSSQGCVQIRILVETTSWGAGHQISLKYTGIQPQHIEPASQGG